MSERLRMKGRSQYNTGMARSAQGLNKNEKIMMRPKLFAKTKPCGAGYRQFMPAATVSMVTQTLTHARLTRRGVFLAATERKNHRQDDRW